MSEAAAGGPAEVQTAGEEGGGAGGEERVHGGRERATHQALGGKCLSHIQKTTAKFSTVADVLNVLDCLYPS